LLFHELFGLDPKNPCCRNPPAKPSREFRVPLLLWEPPPPRFEFQLLLGVVSGLRFEFELVL